MCWVGVYSTLLFVFNCILEPSLLGSPGLLSNPTLLGASVRRDNNTVDSDYDMKRRALGTKQGLDLKNQSSVQPPLLSKLPAQASSSSILPQGGWLVEEDIRDRKSVV